MHNRKILSLLLALVLVFTAAGTAFAASKTVVAGELGKLTGTIIQDSGPFVGWTVTATASITRVLGNTKLSLGVHWVPTNDPTYTTFGDNEQEISNRFFVPFTTLESAPTRAYGYYEVYDPNAGRFSTSAETPLTKPE